MSVFHLITVATWEVFVFDGFLNSAFVISPQKITFIVRNMQKTEEKNIRHMCIQFQEPYTNILKQRYLEVPTDLFTFAKKSLNKTSLFQRYLCQQNFFVLRIMSLKEKPVPKGHIFKNHILIFLTLILIRIFASF